MPYPGVPAKDTPKMERCVKDVMATGKDKSSAIAICHSRIVGDKKKLHDETNSKGGDNMNKNDTKTTEVTKDPATAVEEVKVTEQTQQPAQPAQPNPGEAGQPVTAPKDANQEDVVATPENSGQPARPDRATDTQPAQPATESTTTVTTEQKPASEAGEGEEVQKEDEAEKAKNKTSDHGKDGHKCDSNCKYYQAPQKKVDGGEETSDKRDETHIDQRFDKIAVMLEKVTEQISALATAQTQKSEAPAEGATETKEETPKDDAAKAEDAKADSKEEVTEKVDASKEEATKSDTSSEGAEKLIKMFEDFKKEVNEKLEKTPATSRAVVYTKGFGNEETVEDADAELTKVNARLAEIQKIKIERPAEYTNAMTDEAFKLINKKDQLQNK